MQLKTKFGFGLVAVGLGILGAWSWWTTTRNFEPMDVPIAFAAGQTVSSEFKLNLDGLYVIEIDAEKTIPIDTLRCLMAVEEDPVNCKDIRPALQAAWILSSNGMQISRGSSQELHSAPVQANGLARVIGEFQGKAGQAYQLQVTFASDGKSIAVAHPRLKVGVASIAYTDIQAASVLVSSITFICTLFGAILLSIAWFAKHGSGHAGSAGPA